MACASERDTELSGICPGCGRRVRGCLSVRDRKADCVVEDYRCLECGYYYFSQDKRLSPEVVARHKGCLDFAPTERRCPKCEQRMMFRCGKLEVGSRRYLWEYELEYVCFECGSWHTESVKGFALQDVNERRTYEKLPPLSRLLEPAEQWGPG